MNFIFFLLVVLKVLVDKRMKLSTLKKDLEPFVGVPVEYFKVFRLSSSGESECSCLTEQLSSYEDGERLNVKLGRALRNGEFKVKLYHLLIDSIEVRISIFSQCVCACACMCICVSYINFYIVKIILIIISYIIFVIFISLTIFCVNGSSQKI